MKIMTTLSVFAAALFFPVALSTPALSDMSADSAAVWQRHVERATSGDLDAVMDDFAEDSVIITTSIVITGKQAIRSFFEEFLSGFDKAAIESTVVNAQTVHDDVVVFNFTVGAFDMTFHDTAIIRDDRIKILTTVGYPTK